MSVEKAINYYDLERLAKRRLPKIIYDFIEGGCDDEGGIDRNQQGFEKLRLVPRYLIDVTKRDQSTTLFGRKYKSPFGISPTGIAALFRPGADLLLAEAARDADVPFVMSGSATALIEDMARIAPEHGWYQLYAARNRKIGDDMIKRAKDSGLPHLMITVDVPVGSKRERNQRNGFTRPLRMTLKTKLEALRHPTWVAEYLRNGMPELSNWVRYAPPGVVGEEVHDFIASEVHADLTWDDMKRIRDLWPRTLSIKGIMHPEDAVRAKAIGVDGVMVSNHGARQLDRSPAPIEVLPAIREAVGPDYTLMLDSGVRRGSDVVTAYCLGANFVFVGRMTLYGVTAGGLPGAKKAIDILSGEVDTIMGQMGAPSIAALGPQFLMWDDKDDLKRNRRP